MTELEQSPEDESVVQIKTEIDRLDGLLKPMDDITDPESPQGTEKMALQEQICATQAKLFEALDESGRSEYIAGCLERLSENYEGLLEVGMPVEPLTVWEDIFGTSTPELPQEIETQIQNFLDSITPAELEEPETE